MDSFSPLLECNDETANYFAVKSGTQPIYKFNQDFYYDYMALFDEIFVSAPLGRCRVAPCLGRCVDHLAATRRSSQKMEEELLLAGED